MQPQNLILKQSCLIKPLGIGVICRKVHFDQKVRATLNDPRVKINTSTRRVNIYFLNKM